MIRIRRNETRNLDGRKVVRLSSPVASSRPTLRSARTPRRC